LQKDFSGSIVEELSELAESARRLQKSISGFVDEVWSQLAACGGGKVTLDLGEFSNLAEPVKVEALRRSLLTLGSGERDLTNEHFKRILEMAQQNVSGRKIELPGGYLVWREYRKLVFAGTKTTQADERISESIKVNVPGQTRFGRFLVEAGIFEAETSAGRYKAGKTSFVEWFDLAKVKLPLSMRCRRAGDRFVPLGQVEEKKVGKFLTAQRVPQRIRKRVLIVADAEKVIWVWPIRICEQAKVTEKTQKILRLQITDSE
jgi:tRNA(Ile)-lysidine synthase